MNKGIWAIIGVVAVIVVVVIIYANLAQSKETPAQVESRPLESSASQSLESSKQAKMTRKTYNTPPKTLSSSEIKGKKVKIATNKGDIVFELFGEAPLAASNFIFLTNEKFYDGLTFHRREEGFVIQGGDPSGNGSGGPGYQFNDEKVTRDYTRGIVAMANAGPNTNGSQFFIMLKDNPLPKNYTIFGKVLSGMETVDKIQVGDVTEEVTVQ